MLNKQRKEILFEKIAGLPLAVRLGGGGAVGAAMRSKNAWGKLVTRGIQRGTAEGLVKADYRLMTPDKHLDWRQKNVRDRNLLDHQRGQEQRRILGKALKDMPPQGTPRGDQLRTWAEGTAIHPTGREFPYAPYRFRKGPDHDMRKQSSFGIGMPKLPSMGQAGKALTKGYKKVKNVVSNIGKPVTKITSLAKAGIPAPKQP